MKVKDFYICNNFFKTIIQAYIIVFYMHHQNFIKINNLQTWLSYKNWPNQLIQIAKEYLGLKKVQSD